MLIKDHWYVGCPSSRLGTTEPQAAQIGEHHVALFRDAEGVAHAVLDRCCHRGVRLSLGRIRHGCIACGYHGWEFDGAGRLVRVPSLGADPELPSASVPSYPTVERDHYVWIWIAGDHAEPTHEPALQGLVDGVWIQQTAIWKTDVMPAVENQLDVAHTPFSHPGIYPGHESAAGTMPTLRPVDFECRSDASSVVVFAPPRGEAEPWPELAPGVGLFELPFRNYVFLDADDTRAIYNWVPLDPGTCRLEFMGYSASGQAWRQKEGEVEVFHLDDELPLLAQDRVLLESAQHALDTGGVQAERSVAPDASPLMARKLVARALDGAAHDARERIQRRVFTCWI